jgi:VanZ family protein
MRLDSFMRRRWLTAYAPLIIWTIFTLGLGSGAASMGETSRFIRPLLEFLFPAADADTLYLYHAAIRKLAHLFQYGVLGLFALHAFTYFKRPVVFALSFVALIAMIDEFRQSFDPARTATPLDVLLDIVGAMLALGVVFAFRRIRRNNADRE